MLTRPDVLSPPVKAVLEDHAWEIGRADVFGGSDVVSEGVRSTLSGLMP